MTFEVSHSLIIDLAILGVTYTLSSIPSSLPKRISSKLSAQLASLDYTHANASRISSEVRRALKYPADNLRVGLKRNVEQLQAKREETAKLKLESEGARKYFAGLMREVNDVRTGVQRVNLEHSPGIAAMYDS